ncbi:MAG: hypothetical protein WC346_09295 [Methanogenium sp.]
MNLKISMRPCDPDELYDMLLRNEITEDDYEDGVDEWQEWEDGVASDYELEDDEEEYDD